jgi:hypothetical protein
VRTCAISAAANHKPVRKRVRPRTAIEMHMYKGHVLDFTVVRTPRQHEMLVVPAPALGGAVTV